MIIFHLADSLEVGAQIRLENLVMASRTKTLYTLELCHSSQCVGNMFEKLLPDLQAADSHTIAFQGERWGAVTKGFFLHIPLSY